MRILYSVGKHQGAAHQIADFLAYNNHEIKIAAYHSLNRFVPNFSWTLDCLHNDEFQARLEYDIRNYNPDIVIIDYEPIVAEIANKLELPIIYCSSIHLLDGIVWRRGTYKATAIVERERKIINKLPESMLKCICAPFEPIIQMDVKPSYEWITPYYSQFSETTDEIAVVVSSHRRAAFKEISIGLPLQFCERGDDVYRRAGTIISDGCCAVISDALFNNRRLLFTPDMHDIEGVLIASAAVASGFGRYLGQIEMMGKSARFELEQHIEKVEEPPHTVTPFLHSKKLHERINEL